jgi:hypothetical protein
MKIFSLVLTVFKKIKMLRKRERTHPAKEEVGKENIRERQSSRPEPLYHSGLRKGNPEA